MWYVNVPEGPDLQRLLRDGAGELHEVSVPAGMVPDQLRAEVHAFAARELHPRFVELVQATPDPFIQLILDVAVPRMAFGLACLLGDAAFVVRPHTAAATAKAASDASSLADALAAEPGAVEAALRAWEARQLEHGRGLVDRGIALGKRSVERRDNLDDHSASSRAAAQRFDGIAQPLQRL